MTDKLDEQIASRDSIIQRQDAEIERLRAENNQLREALDLYFTTGGGSPVAHHRFIKAALAALDNSNPEQQDTKSETADHIGDD